MDYVALGKTTGDMAIEILNGKNAAETPVLTVSDSFTVANSDVLSELGLSLPTGLGEIETVTTSAE